MVTEIHLDAGQLQDGFGHGSTNLEAPGPIEGVHQTLVGGASILTLQVRAAELDCGGLEEAQLFLAAYIGHRLIQEVRELPLPARIRRGEEAGAREVRAHLTESGVICFPHSVMMSVFWAPPCGDPHLVRDQAPAVGTAPA